VYAMVGCVCRCEAGAKGESGSSSSALNRDGGRGGEKTRRPAARHRWPADHPGMKGIKGRGNG
jgi:hypothetical protein